MTWFWLLAAGIAVWVFSDAKRRAAGSPWAWALGTLCLLIVVLPLYLAKRPLLTGEVREGGTAWNVLRYFAVVWTITMVVIGLSYAAALGSLAPPEPKTYGELINAPRVSGAEQAGFAIGAMLGFGTLAALWFFPMVGALILGFFLKNSAIVERGSPHQAQTS